MFRSDPNTEFSRIISEVNSGSEKAAWELVSLYGDHIHRCVRRALHHGLRSKFDSLDFVQIVWASIFRAPGKLKGIQSPDEFVRLLAAMAKFKVLTEVRKRFGAAKYNVRLEVPLDSAGMPQTTRVPTPSAVAIARERWEQILRSESDKVRQIVTLRLKGETFVEIADQLGIHERTARKAIERLTNHDSSEENDSQYLL